LVGWLVGWSLTSLFGTNAAISETIMAQLLSSGHPGLLVAELHIDVQAFVPVGVHDLRCKMFKGSTSCLHHLLPAPKMSSHKSKVDLS